MKPILSFVVTLASIGLAMPVAAGDAVILQVTNALFLLAAADVEPAIWRYKFSNPEDGWFKAGFIDSSLQEGLFLAPITTMRAFDIPPTSGLWPWRQHA